MGYLRGFIPWIVSGVVSSFDWRWGAMGGLVTGLLLLLQDRRRGVDLDALVLEISAIVYFVVVGAVAVTDPDSVLADHTDVISFGWLAATAWGTMAIRRPFTLGIARRQTPREYWDMPEFIRVNNRITAAWAGISAHVAGLVGPAVFTKVHPARAQARLPAQAPATAAP